MAGYNDSEGPYTGGAAGFFTHLTHLTDITNKFDKDATPTSGQVLAWNGTVYVPTSAATGTEVINVKDAAYGALGNDSANDTTAIAAAIAAANSAGDTIPVFFPPGVYRTTGITLNNYTKIISHGATLKRHSGTSPIITVPAQGALQTANYSLIQGLLLDGATITAGTIGLKVNNHAALILKDIRATNLETGFSIVNGQFGSAYSLKAYACTVGTYIESTLAGGGGNSWSFYDLQCVGNTVGIVMIGKSSGTFPFHSILFRNPTLLGNTVCAFAAFYCNNVVIDGSANEFNATGASTLSYQSNTIKKSSIHLSNSQLTFTNSYIAEATADPVILAENSSYATLSDIGGYGQASGYIVSADATSSCNVAGSLDSIGVLDNVTNYDATIIGLQLAFVTAPTVTVTRGIPNDIASPQTLTMADTSGAAGSGSGVDTVYGAYTSVTFAASVGSQASNRVRVDVTYAGTTAIFSCLAQASVATTVKIGEFTNIGVRPFKLPAGQWVRLVWMFTGVTPGAQSFIIYPNDAVGATIKFCKVQQVSGTNSPWLRGQINAVATGSYNPLASDYIAGSVTYDPPSLAAGVAANTTVTVTGAAVGDTVLATHTSVETAATSWVVTGYVSAANTVRVVILNGTGGTVDLGSGTLRVQVFKQ